MWILHFTSLKWFSMTSQVLLFPLQISPLDREQCSCFAEEDGLRQVDLVDQFLLWRCDVAGWEESGEFDRRSVVTNVRWKRCGVWRKSKSVLVWTRIENCSRWRWVQVTKKSNEISSRVKHFALPSGYAHSHMSIVIPFYKKWAI